MNVTSEQLLLKIGTLTVESDWLRARVAEQQGRIRDLEIEKIQLSKQLAAEKTEAAE